MSTPEQTTFDAAYLMSLAREKSSDGRSRLTRIIIDLFDNQTQELTDRQRSLMFGILESVISDVEESVREAVAGRLALMNDVPRYIISHLANDSIKIAYPILTKSGLLRDADLIEVIRLRSEEHMLAITMRNTVSEPVSEAIVETGRKPVIISLLKNPNARISQTAMAYLVEQSRRVDSFQEPILNRDDLPPALAKRMYLWVSAALRSHIVTQFNLDPSTVDELLEQIASEQSVSVNTHEEKKSAILASALKDEGLVNVDMLLDAMREGEIPLFISLFAKVTKLREFLVQKLVFEPGGEGLAIACRAIGMSEHEFIKLFDYCQRAKAGKYEVGEKAYAALREFYGLTPRKAALDVLRMWHRGSDYLSALRELDLRLKAHDRT